MRSPVIVEAIALALVASACGLRAEQATDPEVVKPAGPIVARIGEDAVTAGEVEALLDETRSSFRVRGRPFPGRGEPYYLDLRDQALRYLIERSANAQEAARLGVQVSEEEIEQEVAKIDPKDLREARRTTGLTIERVRADLRDRLLDRGVFKALVGRADETDNLEEPKSLWRERLESLLADVRYAPGWKPAEKLRSPTPPELQNLPKPRGPCDLKEGTFTFREAWAHGCAQEWGLSVPGADFAPCPEIPIDDFVVAGFSGEESETGYDLWNMDDNAPSCQPYPSDRITVRTGRGPCFGRTHGSGKERCVQTWISEG
jgi:hypothetical protein